MRSRLLPPTVALTLVACGPSFTTDPVDDAAAPELDAGTVDAPPAPEAAPPPPLDAPLAVLNQPDASEPVDAPPDAAPPSLDACTPVRLTSTCTHHDTVNVPDEVCWYQSNNGTHGTAKAPAACACDFTCACARLAPNCSVASCAEIDGRVEVTCR